MSKQVSAKELAEIVTRLLTDVQTTGELDDSDVYSSFMTGIAEVVCDHCGGEIHHPADSLDDIWYIGIHGTDSLPSAFGGIWREYDKEGELFDDANPQSKIEILEHTISFTLRGENAPNELDECSIEHIKRLVKEGYREGELLVTAPDSDIEYRGWWSIQS